MIMIMVCSLLFPCLFMLFSLPFLSEWQSLLWTHLSVPSAGHQDHYRDYDYYYELSLPSAGIFVIIIKSQTITIQPQS